MSHRHQWLVFVGVEVKVEVLKQGSACVCLILSNLALSLGHRVGQKQTVQRSQDPPARQTPGWVPGSLSLGLRMQ